MNEDWDTQVSLIEKTGPGLSLFQDFFHNRSAGIPRPIAILPEGNKVIRMEAQSSKIEAGQVHLPKNAAWVGDFMNEMLAFPKAKHDDQVDSVSQFLNWTSKPWRKKRRSGSIGAPIIVR